MGSESPFDLRKRLHDGLCQHLTAALMLADAFCRNLQERGAPEADDGRRLVEILHQSADELIAVMDLVAENPSRPPEDQGGESASPSTFK